MRFEYQTFKYANFKGARRFRVDKSMGEHREDSPE